MLTLFEEFAKETLGTVETNENGFYTGETKRLALIACDVVLSDKSPFFEANWDEKKKAIIARYWKETKEMEEKNITCSMNRATGTWIPYEGLLTTPTHYCSKCNATVNLRDEAYFYCPYCGSKMENPYALPKRK